MQIFGVGFAGRHVKICYDSDDVAVFIDFLFSDLSSQLFEEYELELTFVRRSEPNTYAIFSTKGLLFEGTLGVKAAAVLYDVVIFNLLNYNNSGIALHAGAISYQGKFILLPGESGAGKSSAVAWLTAHGFSYATDELVFLHECDLSRVVSFTRPICLKHGSVEPIIAEITGPKHTILKDEWGAIVPHRLLNADYAVSSLSPGLIVFPTYKNDIPARLEKLSGAQVSTRLMACCANARNLKGHGFREIVNMARSLPAYQITYNNFNEFGKVVEDLFSTLGRK